MKKYFFSLILCVTFLFALLPFGMAANSFWVGRGDGVSWSDSRNWLTRNVPQYDDIVYICGAPAYVSGDINMNVNYTYVRPLNAVYTYGYSTDYGYKATITVDNRGKLYSKNTISLYGTHFIQTGGEVKSDGSVNISYSFAYNYNASSYDMSNGILRTRILNVEGRSSNPYATTKFVQSGGSVIVSASSRERYSKATIHSMSQYEISGGSFKASEMVIEDEAAKFIQTDGNVEIGTVVGNAYGYRKLYIRHGGSYVYNPGNNTNTTFYALNIGMDNGFFYQYGGNLGLVDRYIKDINNGGIFNGYGNIYTDRFLNYFYNRGYKDGTIVIGNTDSGGSLNIFGDFWQYSVGSKVKFDLFGNSDYDKINISNKAYFGGGFVDIDLANGYDPVVGSLFNIIHTDSSLMISDNVTFNLPQLSGGKWWEMMKTDNDLSLVVRGPAATVVPEPASVMLLFLSAGFYVFRRKG